jgi:hypothetical protein
MRYSMKLLAAAVIGVAVIGAAQAKPGNGGKSSGGGRPSGSFKVQHSKGNPFVNRKLDFVRHDRVVVNHVRSGFKYTIAHCPTKSYAKFNFGYCFHGKVCNHWQHKCWIPTYGCYFYYCPYTYCEYWYCVEDDCYYPVGYCPAAYVVKYKFGW